MHSQFISRFIRRLRRRGKWLFFLFSFMIVTTLILGGGVKYRYIHKEQRVRSTVRKVAAKAVMLKKNLLTDCFTHIMLVEHLFTAAVTDSAHLDISDNNFIPADLLLFALAK